MATTDAQIQKAIREGLNTIRLHDREVRSRKLRQQKMTENDNRHNSEQGSDEGSQLSEERDFIEAHAHGHDDADSPAEAYE